MKCPYRKQTTTKGKGENTITYEEFMDCYAGDCPYFESADPTYRECKRAEIEYFHATHLGR